MSAHFKNEFLKSLVEGHSRCSTPRTKLSTLPSIHPLVYKWTGQMLWEPQASHVSLSLCLLRQKMGQQSFVRKYFLTDVVAHGCNLSIREDHEFEASLDCTVRPCLNKSEETNFSLFPEKIPS